jgi:hypothetical protein
MVVVVMCWIDESNQAYHKSEGDVAFNEDLNDYTVLKNSAKLKGYALKTGCFVPLEEGGTIEDVLPVNYFDPDDPPDSVSEEELPVGIHMKEFPRDESPPPSPPCNGTAILADFTENFDWIRGDLVPDYLVLIVDWSGSMETCTINPGTEYPYDDPAPPGGDDGFKQWIRDKYPGTVVEPRDVDGVFEDEDWVNEIVTAVEEDVLPD